MDSFSDMANKPVAASIPSDFGMTMLTNDHLAFVKVTGPWDDGTAEEMEDGSNGQPDMEQMPLENRLEILKTKIDLYFKWFHIANYTSLLRQFINPAQFLQLRNVAYDSDSERFEEKLLAEMGAFSAGLSHGDYKQFDKSAFMCLHINPNGIPSTTEKDGSTGWWLPLEHHFMALRAMAFQQPLSALRFLSGLTSMTVDSGNLNVVFRGSQLAHIGIDGMEWNDMELYVAPPNNIPDFRGVIQ